MPPIPTVVVASNLTGNVRTRIGGIFRLRLILQVEETFRRVHFWDGKEAPATTRWRDAKHTDLHKIRLTSSPLCAPPNA